MKVAIYLRVGSDEQIIKEPTTLEHLKDIQQYCLSKGWIKTGKYIAEAIKVRLLN